MRRLRSALQTIRAFLLQGARATLWDMPAEGPAATRALARTIGGLLVILAAFALVAFILWSFLQNTMRPSDFDQRKEVIVLFAQGLGLASLLVTLIFTYLRLRAAERTIQISQEGQITERFTRAIQQLGDPKLEVRLGGVYALERIARDSPRDHWTIMELLTAYVRENAPWKDNPPPSQPAGQTGTPTQTSGAAPPSPAIKPRTDIQAALTVIGRRPEKARQEERKSNLTLDLRSADLRGANLANAHMEGAIIRDAHMEGADIRDAHMEGADLMSAHMERTYLMYAHMEGADLIDTHMEEAIIRHAHMEGADLRGARMERAILASAHMEGADLHDATGLTREQLDPAITDKDTILPEYLKDQSSAPPSP